MTSRSPLSLRILSPEGTILDIDEALSVNVPLVDGGSIGIRPGHTALIAETIQGHVRYVTAQAEEQIELMPGILSISDNVVTILTAHRVREVQMETMDQQTDEFSKLIRNISQRLQPEDEGHDD